MQGKYTIPKFPPQLIIPTSFQDCLTYAQKQNYMWKVIENLNERVDELERKVDELTKNN